MGFFTDAESGSLTIERMNFQIVGDGEFSPRPAMARVEQAEFFLGRIRDVDVASIFKFSRASTTRQVISDIANDRTRFATGALSLAREFHRHHVGQSSAGAYFFFELGCQSARTQLFAMLKYDYSEVLTLRNNSSEEQLRRIVHAFVKDRRSLQKSALIRVRSGSVETSISA